MRVCIYGAGVIGGILGAGLARAGHEVSLVARGAQLEAIRTHGLRIRDSQGMFSVSIRASADPAEFGEQDLVIVATKTPALREVAARIAGLLGRDTLVAFANNGVFWFYGDGFSPGGLSLDMRRLDPTGALHRVVGAERAIGIICYAGGEVVEPGIIEFGAARRQFIAGAAMPQTVESANAVIDSFHAKEYTISATDDIRAAMWPKYVSVVGNQAVAALTGGNAGQNWAMPQLREVLLGLMEEAAEVAAAHGYGALGIDFAALRERGIDSAHKPSMLQDLERGREMEIDGQLLALQDLARQSGIATPRLDTLVPLVIQRARLTGCYACAQPDADSAA